jgi:hypothetical protein
MVDAQAQHIKELLEMEEYFEQWLKVREFEEKDENIFKKLQCAYSLHVTQKILLIQALLTDLYDCVKETHFANHKEKEYDCEFIKGTIEKILNKLLKYYNYVTKLYDDDDEEDF